MIQNLVALTGLALVSARIYSDNALLKVSKYEVKSDKIPKKFNKFKIIHLSDLHSCNFGKNNSKLIEKVNHEHPDIIVMTGDMVNKYDENFDVFFNLAEILSEKYKIYYILGNHEQRLKKDDLNLIIRKLNELGIRILSNEKITIMRDRDRVNIYGIDIPISYYKIRNKPSNVDQVINEALNKCKEKEYNILLAHNPLYFEEYAKHNVDLTLSGHVHGGMIRLPFIGALLSPERKLFPKYSSGVYKKNNKNLIVSRGIGHSKSGIRVFNMPEIVSITLLN